MLFLLNSLDPVRLDEARIMGGREDKSLLLYGDAAYYATQSMFNKLADLEFEEVFVSEGSLASRNITLDQGVEAVGYDKIADMIINDHDRVVSL